MHKEFDDYFSTMAALKKRDLTSTERLEQLNSLKKSLVDWGLHIFPQISFQVFLAYDEYGQYPYPGTFLSQPSYVREELTHWTLLKRFWELNSELPSVDGIPTLDELINK